MTETRSSGFRMIAAWALGAAMLTALVQVLSMAFRHFVLGNFIWVSREYVWMIPAGYALIFAAVGVLLAGLSAVNPRLVGARATGFIFGSLGSLAILLLVPRLHPAALLLLALGIGSRVAVWASGDARHRTRAMARAGIVLALAFAVAGAATAATRRWNERTAIESLGTAPARAPNVLLIILDTVRAADIGFLGYERDTSPAIGRRGGEGAVFAQAHATAPWTLPSHAGMFTGLYPSAMQADWLKPLQEEPPTIAEVFRAKGYATAGFAANHFYTGWESGLTRGFVHYEDYLVTTRQVLLSTTYFQTNLWRFVRYNHSVRDVLQALIHLDLRTHPMWNSDRANARRMASDFLAWERSRPARPFFAFINLFDAHAPYDPPPPWRQRFAAKPTERDGYDGAIAYTDHEVGSLLDSLERRGALDNTIVVITSDHGEELGEHGLTGHGKSLYRMELHVPLVIRYPPRVPRGTRVSKVVTLRDLGATILDLASINPSRPFPGVSLAKTWGDSVAPASDVIAEVSAGIRTEPGDPVSRGPMRTLIDEQMHYILNGDDVDELYDWHRDPGELQNIAHVETTLVGLARQRLGFPSPPRSSTQQTEAARRARDSAR
jgi:arylsulfatase A-like enzyme